MWFCFQEDLLEKQPVLICNDGMDFEFDDTNEINEDTIIVTGFTVRSLDNKYIIVCIYFLNFLFQQGQPPGVHILEEDAERRERAAEGRRPG